MTATEDPILERMVEVLVGAYQPERIVLFGSRARGEATPDSDYDLMVIVPDDAPRAQRLPFLAYRRLLDVGWSGDILVSTRSRFRERARVVTSIPATVEREGVELYAAG